MAMVWSECLVNLYSLFLTDYVCCALNQNGWPFTRKLSSFLLVLCNSVDVLMEIIVVMI
jgi:hypothetical protein